MIQRVARESGNQSSPTTLLMKSEDVNSLPSASPANPVRYPPNNNNNNRSNNNNRGRNSNHGNKGRNSGRGGRSNNDGGGSGGSQNYGGGGRGQYPQWQQQFPWQQQWQQYPWAPPPCPYPSYWAKPNAGPEHQQSGILGLKPQPAAFTATGPSPTDIEAALHTLHLAQLTHPGIWTLEQRLT